MDNVNHPKHYEFQSTLSMRRATPAFRALPSHGAFQSTLSMRRATSLLKHLGWLF